MKAPFVLPYERLNGRPRTSRGESYANGRLRNACEPVRLRQPAPALLRERQGWLARESRVVDRPPDCDPAGPSDRADDREVGDPVQD